MYTVVISGFYREDYGSLLRVQGDTLPCQYLTRTQVSDTCLPYNSEQDTRT